MSLDKLKSKLTNLKSEGVTQITLDVDYLIEVLGIYVPSIKEKPIVNDKVNVDGGKFGDGQDT